MIEWRGDAGFWGCAAVGWIVGGGSGGGVLSGFARFFGYLDRCGRLEGLDGGSPLPLVHGMADGLGGWLGLLASFFVVLLFQIQKHFKRSERRLSF